MEYDDEQRIQYDVDDTADDQIVQGMSGSPVARRIAESHIVDQDKDDSGKIDPKVNNGICMTSAGVCIRARSAGADRIPITVSAIPPAAAMAYAL